MKVTVDLHPFATQEYGYLIFDLTCTNVSGDTLSLLSSYHGETIGTEYHQLYSADGETPVHWYSGTSHIISKKRTLPPSESYNAQVFLYGYGTNPEHFKKDPLLYGPLLTEGKYILKVRVPYSIEGSRDTKYATAAFKFDVEGATEAEQQAITELPQWWDAVKMDHVRDTILACNYVMSVLRNKDIRGGVKYRVLERTSWLNKYYNTRDAAEIIDTLLAMPFSELQGVEIRTLVERNPHAKALMSRMLKDLPGKRIDPRNRKWLERYAKRIVEGE